MYYIGVDLGGTSMKVGLLNEAYKIIEHGTAPTGKEKSPKEIIEDMAKLCLDVLDKQNLTTKDIHSIGIGCPGIASPKEGKIHYASNLNFEDVDVRGLMKAHMDVEVYVDNDANCAALGEAMCGVAKGKKNVVVVTLGTGVGGGIIIDGKIYGGGFCGAGEVGHHIIELNGRPCGCGRKGCWEQYASATALIREAKEAAKNNPHTQMLKRVNHNRDAINAKVVYDAAQDGDEVAQNVLNQYFKFIAQGVTNIINIMQPDAIVLGGGMSAQKEKLITPIKRYVEEEMYGGLELKTELLAATLGNEAGIIGAALIGKTL